MRRPARVEVAMPDRSGAHGIIGTGASRAGRRA
jgi:hypothetical protein